MPAAIMEEFLLQQLQHSSSSTVGRTALLKPDSASASDTPSRTQSMVAAAGKGAASSFSSQATQLQAPYLQQQAAGQQRWQLQPATGTATAADTASAVASLTVAADVDNLLQAVLGAAQQIMQKREQLLQHQQPQQQQQQRPSSPSISGLQRILSGTSRSGGTAATGTKTLQQVSVLHQQMAAAAADPNHLNTARTVSSSSMLLHTLSEVAGNLPLSAAAGIAAESSQHGLSALFSTDPQHAPSGVDPQLSNQAAAAAAAVDSAQQTQSLLHRLTSHMHQQQQSEPVLQAIAAVSAAAGGTPEPAAASTLLAGTTPLMHKQHTPPPPAAGAAGVVPELSGLSGADVSCGGSDLDLGFARPRSETSTGAFTAAAALGQGPPPAAGVVDKHMLQRVLQEVVVTKKQALACVREAVALGILVPGLVTAAATALPQPTHDAAAAADAASPAHRQQQKRGREEDTAGDGQSTPAKKLHRLSVKTGPAPEPAEPTATVKEAADTQGEKAEAETAEAAAGDEQTPQSVSTAAAAGLDAADFDRFPSNLSVTASHAVAAQQQQVAEAVTPLATPTANDLKPAADTGPTASTSAAAGAPPIALSSPEVAAALPQQHLQLMLRTVAVMCKSNKLNKALAAMVVPCVTAAQQAAAQQAAAQQAQQLGAQQMLAAAAAGGGGGDGAASGSNPLATQQEIQSLRQKLMLAKVSLSVKQQAVLKLQAEAQAAAAAHTRQLQLVSEAVRKLMDAAGAEGVQVQDKQRLVGIAAEILRAVV